VASQELGPLGARDGPAASVDCPAVDALRSVAGWFVVVLLLALRKANRSKEAWALLAPLAVLYLLLAVAERGLNAYLVFHYHQYICSSVADLLRYFALSLTILLAVTDKFVIPWRFLRWVLALLFLFLCGDVQIATNQWPFLEAGVWPILLAVFLLAFMLGHSVVHAILRRRFGSARFSWWYACFCLVFGLVPLLILGMMEAHLSRSVQLSSTLEQFRAVVVLTSAITLPYLVFSAFIILALFNRTYRQRFTRAFGVGLLPPPPAQVELPDPLVVQR
jgi:hypothetical protein